MFTRRPISRLVLSRPSLAFCDQITEYLRTWIVKSSLWTLFRNMLKNWLHKPSAHASMLSWMCPSGCHWLQWETELGARAIFQTTKKLTAKFKQWREPQAGLLHWMFSVCNLLNKKSGIGNTSRSFVWMPSALQVLSFNFFIFWRHTAHQRVHQ